MANVTEESIRVRHPAVAGRFYPADPMTLTADVQRYLDAAQTPPLDRVRAVIAPHAGYICSGPVAGYSFKTLGALPPDETYTVFLIGPAHWASVDGVALSAATHFATPLGRIPLDTAACDALLAMGSPFYLADTPHRPEHALEIELPFLQSVLPRFYIVPLLLHDERWSAQLGEALACLLEERPASLVVVSSDLSHFRTYADAQARDERFLQAVVNGDLDAAREGEACGWPAIMALMLLAERQGWTARRLAYANSGDTCSGHRSVVGYGAVAYMA